MTLYEKYVIVQRSTYQFEIWELTGSFQEGLVERSFLADTRRYSKLFAETDDLEKAQKIKSALDAA